MLQRKLDSSGISTVSNDGHYSQWFAKKDEDKSLTEYKDFSMWQDLTGLASMLDCEEDELRTFFIDNGVPKDHLPFIGDQRK